MAIQTERELADALNNKQDIIEIEGDLTKRIIKIKATGKTAWIVAIGAVAATLMLVTSGAAAPVGGATGLTAVSVLGFSTTASVVAIAVAAGGVSALNALRNYKVISHSDEKLILSRK